MKSISDCPFCSFSSTGVKMINLEELEASTVEALKKLYYEHSETVCYMEKRGTALEKAIAAVILAASGGK